MIERVSGKILINTIIDRQDIVTHNTKTLPFWNYIARSKAKAVYSSTRKDISHVDVHEIALKIQQVGITLDTIILVYHISTFGLTLLRQFLESAGYSAVLPPDKNCNTHGQYSSPASIKTVAIRQVVFPKTGCTSCTLDMAWLG
ncbi:hypothetical protein F4680DRAFT_405137 [Xylaria scruposa]|nr:hypothetical protein F4680DRAFT_405137 [Xylaria scruposa]